MSAVSPYYLPKANHESAFAIEAASIKFGPGVLAELGADARGLNLRRVLLVTDPRVRTLAPFDVALESLRQAGVDVVVYDEAEVEPTDRSMERAARAAAEARVDGLVSLGGGSVIDTAKAANLYSCHPAPFIDYVNAPIGLARPVPGPLKPHIACPTTFGTASETTGIAAFGLTERAIKTTIAARAIRPTLGLLDPTSLYHLPAGVVAANGFDVLSHAIESYTARPFTERLAPAHPGDRPVTQGANPFGALPCLEAIRLAAGFLLRAVTDPDDRAARHQLMFAGLLAGIGFGNSGNHLPHAMSYPVAALVRDYVAPGWPADHPQVPHGFAVAVNAPAAFRHTATAAPERYRHVLAALGGGPVNNDALDDDALGAAISDHLVALMRQTDAPNGLTAIGYGEADLAGLAENAFRQKRLIDNAPGAVTIADLEAIYRSALRYW